MDDASNQFVRIDDLRTMLNDLLTKVATKDDLTAFATKDDLSAFATKDDLNAFATKEDLNEFATKSDINNLKKDIAGLTREVRAIKKDVGTLKSDSNKLKLKMRSNSEFQDKIMLHVLSMKHTIEEQLVNKYAFDQLKNDIFIQLDAVGRYEETNQIEHETQDYRMKKMSKALKHEQLRNDEQDVTIGGNQEKIETLKAKVA